MVFGSTVSERHLAQLFANKFKGSDNELCVFLRRVESLKLPFSLLEQIRCREYPGYSGFECGLPTIYYYYIPDAGRGGHNPKPSDPLALISANTTDGFGQNFGCPLRLKRALEVLDSLPQAEQREPREKLILPQQHLAVVEELLWTDIWNSPISIHRSEGVPPITHDWIISFNDVVVRLECKFLQSDWLRVTDGDSHKPQPGAFGNKATRQLPNPPQRAAINVAAVTGLGPVTGDFREFVNQELLKYTNIEAVIYRPMVGEISVFSLKQDIARAVVRLIRTQDADEFQPIFIVCERPERDRRESARTKSAPISHNAAKLFEEVVPGSPSSAQITPPPLPYRFALKERSPTGEPIYEWVPPFLTNQA